MKENRMLRDWIFTNLDNGAFLDGTHPFRDNNNVILYTNYGNLSIKRPQRYRKKLAGRSDIPAS